MSSVTLAMVLEQARQLPPTDQAHLINGLIATANTALVHWPHVLLDDEDTDDVDEQRETWAYLQRVLDEDRLSARKLFPPQTEQP